MKGTQHKCVYSASNIYSSTLDWSKRVTWLNIPELKYFNDIPQFQFQSGACCEKYLKDNEHNGRYLPQKYARIFTLEHYLSFKAQTVPFSEQIMPPEKYPNIFPLQMEAIVYILHY